MCINISMKLDFLFYYLLNTYNKIMNNVTNAFDIYNNLIDTLNNKIKNVAQFYAIIIK